MDPASGAIITASALAAGAYLNAKLHLGTDLKQLRWDRLWGKRLGDRIQKAGNTCTLYRMFEVVDEKAECLWFEGKTWSYGEMKNDVNRMAALLEGEGMKKGDTIALFTTNCPEMVVSVLACSKLSVIAAMINTSLRDDTLKHCMNIAKARMAISTPDLSEFIPPSLPHFTINLGSFTNPPPTDSSITLLTSQTLPAPSTTPPAKAAINDLALLIYTSGTTGKPKACAIRNHLIFVTSTPLTQDIDEPSKYFPLRTYSPLPLFHGTAFFTGVAYSMGTGSTLCLARKFSASRFFKDVTESQATRILYVGELCRYLVLSPPSPYDQAHKCIVASGNGLRGEIWHTFKTRFNIPEVREFYRSTEGLAKFDNFNKGAWGHGRVGFFGPLRRYMETDTMIIRVDTATEMPYRDPATGFCVRAKIGEPGEVIGRVKARGLLTEYLNNTAATEEKLMFDVFKKGDLWQKMGDLIVHEDDGWIRFHDRMGDTFRWKGENVSAGEVRDALAKIDGVVDAAVYGVKLASYDGQAGACALTLSPSLSTPSSEAAFISSLYPSLKKTGLPDYAMPRLVRITREIEANATFKKAKQELLKKSWKAEKGGDALYWLDGKTYRILDSAAWGGIESGKAKL